MIVHIVGDGEFVQAMGHRVALHLGGEPELRRRVLGTLAQLDVPPDEVRFERMEATRTEAARSSPTEPEPQPAASPEPPPPQPPAPPAKPPPRRGKGRP